MTAELLAVLRIVRIDRLVIQYKLFYYRNEHTLPFKVVYTITSKNSIFGGSKSFENLEEALESIAHRLVDDRKYIRFVSYRFINRNVSKELEKLVSMVLLQYM